MFNPLSAIVIITNFYKTLILNTMRNFKYCLILAVIAFVLMNSCANIPDCEHKPYDPENMLLLGIYHALILPFSVVGKVFGLNIGIHSVEYSQFSYWIGFLIGLVGYGRLLLLLGAAIKN